MTAYRRFVALLLLTAGTVTTFLLFGRSLPEGANVVLCVWSFMLGPVFLLLTARDAKEEIDAEGATGFLAGLMRILLAGPLCCGGLILMGASLTAFGVFGWQVLVEGHLSWLKSSPGLLMFAGMFAVGCYLLRKGWKRGMSRAEITEANAARHRALLSQPDWSWYERHLGRPVPLGLRQFYEEGKHLAVSLPGWDFNPISADYLIGPEHSALEGDVLPLALHDEGPAIFLKPGAQKDDTLFQIDLEDPKAPPTVHSPSFEAFLATAASQAASS